MTDWASLVLDYGTKVREQEKAGSGERGVFGLGRVGGIMGKVVFHPGPPPAVGRPDTRDGEKKWR
jgi:hypothetical protein